MQTYDEVSQAYRRIFDRVGVKYCTVRGRPFCFFTVVAPLARRTSISLLGCWHDMFARAHQVEADTGSIGGNQSHEFHIPCSAGEDTLLVCTASASAAASASSSAATAGTAGTGCQYAANVEKAVSRAPEPMTVAQQAEWKAKELVRAAALYARRLIVSAHHACVLFVRRLGRSPILLEIRAF